MDAPKIPDISDNYPEKISELKKLARQNGATDDELDELDDAKNRRQALIKFLKKKNVTCEPKAAPTAEPKAEAKAEATAEATAEPKAAPTVEATAEPKAEVRNLIDFGPNEIVPPEVEPEPEPEPETESGPVSNDPVFGDTTLIFEGVEYMWDKSDNELTDTETYDVVGKWIPDSKHIEFESDEMADKHKSHENNVFNKPQ